MGKWSKKEEELIDIDNRVVIPMGWEVGGGERGYRINGNGKNTINIPFI